MLGIQSIPATLLAFATIGCARQEPPSPHPLESLVSWVAEKHAVTVSRPDETSVHYFVTSGVEAPRYFFIDPLIDSGELGNESTLPKTTYCVVAGLRAADMTNVATACRIVTYADNRTVQDVYVLLWDRKRGQWGVVMSRE